MNPEFLFEDLTLVLNFFKEDFSMCSMYLKILLLGWASSSACIWLNISKLLITICQWKVMKKMQYPTFGNAQSSENP